MNGQASQEQKKPHRAAKISGRTVMLTSIALAVLSAPLWWPVTAAFLAPQDDNPAALSLGKQPRVMELEDVVFLQARGNRQEISLAANSANTTDADEYLKLFVVTTSVIDTNGKTAQITGNEALYEQNRQAITLTGDVHVLLEKLTATSEQVSYFTEHQRIETRTSVQIDSEKLTVTGTGLAYDLGSGRLKMGGLGAGRVHCTIL